jgi:tetratricopeptide (TPR) repeat protein
MKVLRLILLSLVAVATVSLLCYQGFVTKELTSSNLTRGLLILAGLILAMFRGPRRGRATKADYKAAYGHLIGTAFSGDPKLEKLLYKALDDFNNRRYSASLKKLEELRIASPKSADRFAVAAFSALCQSRMGNFDEAIRLYSSALMIREHSTVSSNMGNCYLELGKTEEALECFHRALRADKANPNALNNIAQLYIQLGEYEEALVYAEAALEINGKMPQALNAMAICYAMLDYDEESETYFRRAVACGSDGKTLRAYINNLRS